MNKFVDFGKRGVDLPAGCKDLIDVLQRAKQRSVPTLTTRSVEGLANIAGHLDNLIEVGAQPKNLVITWQEGLNYVHLTNRRCVITALAVIHDSAQREQAVREVFEEGGLALVHDETLAAFSVRLLSYSFQADPSNIGGLISELLGRGYGLAENVRFEIGSWEDDAS